MLCRNIVDYDRRYWYEDHLLTDYVEMREDLKGQNLTFTEIAKLVGENWQNLNRVEKEPFERQAHEAKERYNRELADYKKTGDYKKYCDYLHDFRKRQATQLQGNAEELG